MGIAGAYMVPHPPLIIPDVGRGKEWEISKTVEAYHEVAREIAELKPETIVVISSHATSYQDYFHISPGNGASGDFSDFMAGQVIVNVTYDTELAEEISRLTAVSGFPAGMAGEQDPRLDHGTMIPLCFVNQYDTEYDLVRIGISGLSGQKHIRMGQYIAKAVENLDRRVVVIASGDLSHRLKEDGPYGFRREGPAYDKKIMEIMGSGAFERLKEFQEPFLEAVAECGHRTFQILAGALGNETVIPRKLSYEGPFGVGYGICAYRIKPKEDPYVKLAREALEAYVRKGETVLLHYKLPEEMTSRKAGVFVSLYLDGQLRGCIGTIEGIRDSIAEEIIENAVSAGIHDPRFEPVEEEELDRLSYSVDVLGKAEKITSAEELDVRRYGVIVTSGWKRGLLLPNLEGIDTVQQQIAVARQKAGIAENAEVTIERFEVVRHLENKDKAG